MGCCPWTLVFMNSRLSIQVCIPRLQSRKVNYTQHVSMLILTTLKYIDNIKITNTHLHKDIKIYVF